MANAQYVRNNAWNSGGTFDNEDLLWYAKGVGRMMSRPIADPQSWWFYAAIHGEYANPNTAWYKEYAPNGVFPAWSAVVAPPAFATTPLPSAEVMTQYWNQCQHGSWYFAPWHRGYLLSLEAQLRQDIVDQGGPATWALPYWDYFGNNGSQFPMPPALKQPTLPDNTPNPLFFTMRYGPNGDDNIFVPTPASNDPNPSMGEVTDTSLNDTVYTYTGTGSQIIPGFGGPATTFSHSGAHHGGLESNPHDLVHAYVGGQPNGPEGQSLYGLMGDPNTAGLDPVFYLHHCNIDRMWASWNAAGNANPTDPAWLQGPTPQFAMPGPNGQPWVYTPAEMQALDSLNYSYQELTPVPVGPSPVAARLLKLGATPQAAAALAPAPGTEPKTTATELMGASANNLRVQGTGISAPVRFDPSVQAKSAARLKSFSDSVANAQVSTPALPDRVFLKLENITGDSEATIFNVYVESREDTDPAVFAGTIALFGLRLASLADGKHGGEGLTFTLNITPIVDQLHLTNNFTASELSVRLVPNKPLAPGKEVQVGRISVYRQAF
ncbi:tyrosinase family protein [Hymenobacter monticola]|uniref:Tyrosinase family protein n=1 Tax=Hymenobacter monticola TaxID=1705399 RepID=A0ABY4B7H4_9BACT|nr:tyrosinase family protein [Hymenobacter monticola]UOE34980.1 tyrosinase family protein [Hymenobacter monticola]